MFIIISVLSSIFFSVFVWFIVDKLEYAMLSTLVGHEVDELVSDIARDPEGTLMPDTVSVKAYLLSRQKTNPIPEYLLELSSNIHSKVAVGSKSYHVAIIELHNDKLFLSFDVTHLTEYSNKLLIVLLCGVIVALTLILIGSLWLSRKFLLPVSMLAEELTHIKPNDRNVRIERKYRDYEVGIIAKSIDQFMVSMDEYVEREQSFTAAVSHELRTPVSVISTSAELLELGGDLSKKQLDILERIKTSTKYMHGVIKSLLYFARQTNEGFEDTIPSIPVIAVFKDIIEEYHAEAEQKNLSIRLKGVTNSMVRIPETHLSIVLGNLVQNAITNTNEGEICVTVLDEGFVVEDTGRGIDSNDISHIVERCYHSPDSPGCGLGLHLVMNICNHYNYKLEINSSVGKGSQFFVKYPENLIT